jgi:hypothetical protein
VFILEGAQFFLKNIPSMPYVVTRGAFSRLPAARGQLDRQMARCIFMPEAICAFG